MFIENICVFALALAVIVGIAAAEPESCYTCANCEQNAESSQKCTKAEGLEALCYTFSATVENVKATVKGCGYKATEHTKDTCEILKAGSPVASTCTSCDTTDCNKNGVAALSLSAMSVIGLVAVALKNVLL